MLGGGSDGGSCRNDCRLGSPGLYSPASSSPIATTTPPEERDGILPMRGGAEEGTGFRLTGSSLGAATRWRDGDLEVEGWERERSSLGRPRSIILHYSSSFEF